jgi:hypothetical protein
MITLHPIYTAKRIQVSARMRCVVGNGPGESVGMVMLLVLVMVIVIVRGMVRV